MTDRTFSSAQAARIAGVSYRRLDYWARIELVTPSIAASGSGSARRYSLADVVALSVVTALTREGIELSHTRPAVSTIRHPATRLDGNVVIVITGHGASVMHAETLATIAAEARRPFLAIPLRPIIESITEAAADTAPPPHRGHLQVVRDQDPSAAGADPVASAAKPSRPGYLAPLLLADEDEERRQPALAPIT